MDFHAFMPELIALGQVIMIDLVLAGDNAIVVGFAAAGFPPARKVIFLGIVAATVLRILFALVLTSCAIISRRGRRPAAALGLLEVLAGAGASAPRAATPRGDVAPGIDQG
jgi:hypothetical protein